MVLSMKIKLLRILSIAQCWLALWLIVLGIVERARIQWMQSGLGMPIWTGVWVAITGSFGVFITFKKLQKLANTLIIPQHLTMTLMGFSLTCGILSTLFISLNAYELSIAGTQTAKFYTRSGDENWRAQSEQVDFHVKHDEEHAIVGSIFAFTLVELILAMWTVGLCFINDRQAMFTNESYDVPLMSPGGQGQDASGAAILS